MITRIHKWGNSLGLRIPRALAAAAKVADGTEVDLAVRAGRLVVGLAPRRARKAPDLRRLLRGVTRANRHGEADFGRAAGREAW